MRSTTASTTTSSSLRRMRSVRVRTVTFAAAGLALAACIALPATAPAASLADKQAQAAQLDREVAKLEDRYGDLQERWRGALVELKEIDADRRDAERKLALAKRDLRRAKRRLQERALAIYRDGNGSSELLQVAEAGSIQEFFDRVDTINRVGTQDAKILGRVRDAAERVEEQEHRLQVASDRQKKVVHRADRAKRKMHKVLSQKQAALGSVTAEIRAIMEQQRAAAAAEAARQARANAATVTGGGTLEAAGTGGGAASTGGDGGGSGSSSSSASDDGASSFVPLPPASGAAAAAASIAMGKSGAPYEFGAAGPSSFDCSGLVVWAFAQAGRPGLPHSTYSLIGMGVEVPLSQAQVGDLVFTNDAGHMGIYVGGGSFVHAPRTGRTVTVESLGYYTVVSVRRI
jgi:cell wall-associated NlpC family hydrolase